MAPISASKANHTPVSKQRLHFNSAKMAHPSPNPNSAMKEANPSLEHPVEVIGRIRDYTTKEKDTQQRNPSGVFQINPDRHMIRVKTEIGYRDFTLDGVSSSEEEDLEGFYKKFVEERINGVKMGAKCTIMMYGPTGSGKSHTMFGYAKEPGIVYRSLKDILGEQEGGEGEEGVGSGMLFVHVTVLEIYNEEIYDLLSCEKAGGGLNLWSKGSSSKVRLEVMGKKAKNASFISGHDAGKISKEIQKVEKRRIVKSTNCNDRSSRSHCMIILDVPAVGGRLMLVDMAGSENIEQAGQLGLEAKMQTGKINQGNIALKRVVESIANGDSHVPFRDSKLTMLLQDSFEDDKSKILMILCASPDPKEMHKTISTLEYGAKAKCIIRGPPTPTDKFGDDSASSVILGSRIAAMDQLILKLQIENKRREKERNEAHKLLLLKEEEVAQLRVKLQKMEVSGASEEEINLKVSERTKRLKQELEKQLEECQRMAKEYVELEKKRMEETIQQQQHEVEILRRRLQEMEIQLSRSRDARSDAGDNLDGACFARRLMEAYGDEGMEKSMDLDMGEESCGREVKIVGGELQKFKANNQQTIARQNFLTGNRIGLSTVAEEEEVEKSEDEEIEKTVIEEKRVTSSPRQTPQSFQPENLKDPNSSRKLRIQNIFTLCGNHRELSQQLRSQDWEQKKSAETNAAVHEKSPLPEPVKEVKLEETNVYRSPTPNKVATESKENMTPKDCDADSLMEVYVKWEATKGTPGKFINKLKVVKDAKLSDLRKLIETNLRIDKDFTFLSLGDPTGAPVPREKEATMPASKLPACSSQLGGHLACLRASKATPSPSCHLPLTPLENMLRITPVSFPTKMMESNVGSTPFITQRKRLGT
ncbi:hypothetical protein Drorol1_Dr00000959 [Drosera rotundifolia]